MANHVGTKLSRLIRERSYLSGELARLRDSERAILAEIEAATERLTRLRDGDIHKARERLNELDRLIHEEAPSIDPNDINVVRRTLRRSSSKHGELIGAVVENLRSSPNGISTHEMASRIAPQFALPWTTREEKSDTISRVRRMLNNLKAKGAVQRLPGEMSANGQEIARWRWIADD
jgi:septation ring formation regulator EzrA